MTRAAARGIEWTHAVREDGVLTYRMGRRGGTLIAEWPRMARLTCRADGSAPRLTPSAGVSRRALDKLRGTVRALLAGLRGGLGLHASAVALGRQGVILLGDSGAGKSTAAAGLCALHGGRLLADDAAVVCTRGGRLVIAPSEARHYLSAASADGVGIPLRGPATRAGKVGVRAARIAARPAPIALAAVLRFDDALDRAVTRRLEGAEAALALLGALYRLDAGDRRAELDRVSRLRAQARFVEISRPHRSPDATAAVMAALGDAP